MPRDRTRLRTDGTPDHLVIRSDRKPTKNCKYCGYPSFRSLCEYHYVYQKTRDRCKQKGAEDDVARDCALIAAGEYDRAFDRRMITQMVWVQSEQMLYYAFGDRGSRRTIETNSGPYGRGAAPSGMYFVADPIMIAANTVNRPYTDGLGLAWFARMHPAFKTSRSGLGIHPDGNVPGTLGCLGVVERNTRKFYEWLKGSPKPMYVQVLS